MKPKRIAIMIELTRSFSRDLIKSIAREARKKYGLAKKMPVTFMIGREGGDACK